MLPTGVPRCVPPHSTRSASSPGTARGRPDAHAPTPVRTARSGRHSSRGDPGSRRRYRLVAPKVTTIGRSAISVFRHAESADMCATAVLCAQQAGRAESAIRAEMRRIIASGVLALRNCHDRDLIASSRQIPLAAYRLTTQRRETRPGDAVQSACGGLP